MWRKRFENVVWDRPRSDEGSGFLKTERHRLRGRLFRVGRKPVSVLTRV
jgi:hypothetical protein